MYSVDEWLSSVETGVPFVHCIHCKLPLLEIDAPWLVNKEYVRGECVLEYAICQPCRDRVVQRLAEDSKAAVRRFLESEIDWEARFEEFSHTADPATRFGTCLVCHAPRAEMNGYAISALFDEAGKLVTGPLPLLICRDCLSRMIGLLSADSWAVWRQFRDDHFSGPPGDPDYPGLL